MAIENKFIAKLSSGFLAVLGALTPDDFSAKFEAAWAALTADVAALKAQNPADLSAFEARIAEIEGKHTETANALTALSTTVASIKPDALIAQAKEAGVLGATEVLGKTGTTAPVGTAPNNERPKAGDVDQMVADGKYPEAWAASKDLQAQFVKPEHYAAYMKAATAGRVLAKSTI
jgi:hypothetical protein